MPIIYSNTQKRKRSTHFVHSSSFRKYNDVQLIEFERERREKKWSERRKMNGHNNLLHSSTYVFCKFKLIKP